MNKKCYICGEKEARVSFYFKKSNVEFAVHEPTCGDKNCLHEYDLIIQESLDNYEELNKELLMEDYYGTERK